MVYRNPKFDLNKKPADFFSSDEFSKDNQFDDTALRLQCFGRSTVSRQDAKPARGDGCRLVVGLGRTPSVCLNDRDSDLKLSLSNCSTSSRSDLNLFSSHQSASVEVSNGVYHVDEGSTSATRSGGYMPSLLLAPRISVPLQKLRISELEPSVVSDFSTETASGQRISSKKCEFSGCANREAEYCREHGSGCSDAAIGKSGLCIKHGGGKRHVEPGCTNSARGRTNCGVKHGGGKRYKSENPTSSSHGSTDIYKTRPGVRPCVCDGEGKYEEFATRGGDLCVAHGSSMVQETKEDKNRFVCTTPRLLYRFVPSPGPGSPDNHSLSCSSAVSSSTSGLAKPAKRRQLIPPQVLVPSSMKASPFLQFTRQSSSGTYHNGQKSLGLVIPEGRVHGGSLLSLLGRNLNDNDNDNENETDGI